MAGKKFLPFDFSSTVDILTVSVTEKKGRRKEKDDDTLEGVDHRIGGLIGGPWQGKVWVGLLE